MNPENVIGEVVKIAMASGLNLPLALVVIFLAAVLIVGLRAVHWKVPPGDPESMKPLPPAQWGGNVGPDDGPPGGGMGGG